ncbi:hypothetical protein HanXRQr2_Chr02g0080681 [Helianthus annuus]|uniref:Uncharacterized protein n=1 Tax=Helianthus annuus TaxID=4232 RepID=A0A9K3P2A7_HELAN|nr:hypothetical protein HanXRQr2_Chr02g0080681 [Helianthus annuus]KAJ0952943.1 hypothetical protein HanPSC8_Chr02g0078181 [Helianthus annuus]
MVEPEVRVRKILWILKFSPPQHQSKITQVIDTSAISDRFTCS